MLNSPSFSSTACEDFNKSSVNSKNSRNQASNFECNAFQPIMLPYPPETTITLTATQSSGYQKNEDSILSLTNNDSGCCQQKKQQRTSSNQNANTRGCGKTNNLTLPSRRNSVFVDTRYSSAPMSIAQRAMQQPPSLSPLNSESGLAKVTKKSPEKKNSPAGVINFIQTHGRITGNAPTITARVSNDYSNEKSNSVHIKSQLSAPGETENVSGAAGPSVSNVGVPNLPSSVLQQKRRNLKNALNNISAIRDGQVSLLKSAHQRQNVEDVDIRPLVTTTVVPHLSLYGSEPSVEEALPEHIIIAAPKKKKDENSMLTCEDPPHLQKILKNPATKSDHSICDINKTTEVPGENLRANSTSSMSSLTDAISLGNVIRDTDLLKLILKALKWPVTAGNCEEQMARLKNSKFAVIMSDNNLLQDTDLTQLLGPYLSPMMPFVQQQSAPKFTTSSPANSPPQTTSELQTIGDCTMPFKLPPETSVQLVPSSPTDQELQHLSTISVVPNQKRSQRKSRVREFQIDEQKIAPASASTSNAALVTNELLNINAMLISQFGSNPADAINEALISMFKQQQEVKTQRPTRSSRRASTTSAPLNLEDIVLVEPQPSLEISSVPVGDITTFKLPAEKIGEPHPITRPIIKRRKANLQISEPSSPESRDKTPMPENIVDSKNNTESEICHELNDNGNTSNQSQKLKDLGPSHILDVPQAPTSTVPEVNTNTQSLSQQQLQIDNENNSAFKVMAIKSTLPSIRKADMKSDLGQKLLEAIGLPQTGKDLPTESSRDTLRSALKRSLKKAQEQQQHLKRVKQEEPVKQLADSTTRSAGAESSEERKKAIAERELELLKRKTKNAEKSNLLLKK